MARADAFAQYMLELVNLFRSDPAGEYDRIVARGQGARAHDPDSAAALSYFRVDLGRFRDELDALDAAPPLAWSDELSDAALRHSSMLRKSDSQSHQVLALGEPPLGTRVEAEGYDYLMLGENVYSYAQSVRNTLDAFIVDWGPGPGGMQRGRGHRETLITAEYREIGIGVAVDTSPTSQVGRYVVTQDLGLRFGSGPILLGVAYEDRDGDGFYSMGEGARLRVRVEAEGSVSSAASGGYAIDVATGARTVVLSGDAVAREIVAVVTFGSDNVKLDVVDGRHLRTSGDLDLLSGGSSVTAIGRGDVAISGRSGADRLIGNAGRNRLDGEGGDDLIAGGDGADRLFGRAGADTLIGGDGKDVLRGGADRDRLSGGDGADTFVFGIRDGRDRILDWEDGDRIRMSGAGRRDLDIGKDDGNAVLHVLDTVIVVVGAAGDIGLGDIDFV